MIEYVNYQGECGFKRTCHVQGGLSKGRWVGDQGRDRNNGKTIIDAILIRQIPLPMTGQLIANDTLNSNRTTYDPVQKLGTVVHFDLKSTLAGGSWVYHTCIIWWIAARGAALYDLVKTIPDIDVERGS